MIDILARFPRARASVTHTCAAGVRKLQQTHSWRLLVSRAMRGQGSQALDWEDSVGAKPFPADPSLSQLEVAKDPKLMREIFQTHLRHLNGRTYQVRECRIQHIRYRRGRPCILQYALCLVEPDTGCERSQWVTGWMHPGRRTQAIWEELRRTDLGLGVPNTSPSFAPFSYILDLDMLVQVCPHDRRLPALPLLMTELPSKLEPLLLTQFGHGNWRTQEWDIELIRYRTEVRATLRLTVHARDAATNRAQEKHFYAKVYAHEETGRRTYQALRALWGKASAGGEDFTVGKPITYLRDLRTLLQQEASGISLRDILLLEQEDEADEAVRKVARALATLHLGPVDGLRRHRLRDEAAALKRRGEFLQWACPRLGPDIEKIVNAMVASLKEVAPTPAHRDLKPEHILLNGDRLTLVDLDSFARADPVLDVASLLAFLTNMPLHARFPHDQRRVQAIEQTFAEEYFAHVPKAWRTRLPLHYAGAVLRLATSLSHEQTPGWSDKVEVLIEQANDSLAGRVW